MTTKVEAEFKTEKISAKSSKRYKFIVQLAADVRQDDQDREPWKKKQIVASNQRQGVQRLVNSPFPGYREVPVPTTDKILKQKKSLFLAVGTQPKKQIVVDLSSHLENDEPALRTSAQKVEKALNRLIRKKDFGWVKKLALFIDYFLENGHALFKVFEKFFSKYSTITIDLDDFSEEEVKKLSALKSEQLREVLAERYDMDLEDKEDSKAINTTIKQFRAGKRVITLDKRDFISEPSVIPVRGLDVIVPASATEVQTLPRLTHNMWVSYEFLKSRANNGIYNDAVVNELSSRSGTSDDSLTNVNWAMQEGLTNAQQMNAGMFNIRECQTLYENENTGKMEKWVFTWLESQGNDEKQNPGGTAKQGSVKILQETKLPFEHGLYTYVKHDNEYKNARWYNSRGVPEQIRGMHFITEKCFNARVIRDVINNAPMFRVSKQLGWNGDELRFRPGQFLEAEAGQIEQINKSITTDTSSSLIENQAKAYIEEYQAIPDIARTNAFSSGEKTATEVETIRASLAQQANTEVSIFLESLSEVANQMYLILKQTVVKPTEIAGVLLTPEDFLPRYNISWMGSIESSNHRVQAAKMVEKINMLANIGASFGIVTQENMYNAFREWLITDTETENPDMFITKPEEIRVDQTEDQMGEIVLMMNGFNPQVKPDDSHKAHLEVIEAWIQTPEGQGAMKNEGTAERVQVHANTHIQGEQLQNGGKGGRVPRQQ